jgi:hypothetical protein
MRHRELLPEHPCSLGPASLALTLDVVAITDDCLWYFRRLLAFAGTRPCGRHGVGVSCMENAEAKEEVDFDGGSHMVALLSESKSKRKREATQ